MAVEALIQCLRVVVRSIVLDRDQLPVQDDPSIRRVRGGLDACQRERETGLTRVHQD
jgi:hypothetical protein